MTMMQTTGRKLSPEYRAALIMQMNASGSIFTPGCTHASFDTLEEAEAAWAPAWDDPAGAADRCDVIICSLCGEIRLLPIFCKTPIDTLQRMLVQSIAATKSWRSLVRQVNTSLHSKWDVSTEETLMGETAAIVNELRRLGWDGECSPREFLAHIPPARPEVDGIGRPA